MLFLSKLHCEPGCPCCKCVHPMRIYCLEVDLNCCTAHCHALASSCILLCVLVTMLCWASMSTNARFQQKLGWQRQRDLVHSKSLWIFVLQAEWEAVSPTESQQCATAQNKSCKTVSAWKRNKWTHYCHQFLTSAQCNFCRTQFKAGIRKQMVQRLFLSQVVLEWLLSLLLHSFLSASGTQKHPPLVIDGWASKTTQENTKGYVVVETLKTTPVWERIPAWACRVYVSGAAVPTPA